MNTNQRRLLWYIIYSRVKRKYPEWSERSVGICSRYALKKAIRRQNKR